MRSILATLNQSILVWFFSVEKYIRSIIATLNQSKTINKYIIVYLWSNNMLTSTVLSVKGAFQDWKVLTNKQTNKRTNHRMLPVNAGVDCRMCDAMSTSRTHLDCKCSWTIQVTTLLSCLTEPTTTTTCYSSRNRMNWLPGNVHDLYGFALFEPVIMNSTNFRLNTP